MLTLTGGEWSRRRIEVTEREVTRYTPQTARKAIFDIIDVEGKSFLDPFSGSGVMVFEALSRRAERATAIDVSRTACKTIRRNMDRLDPSMKLDILCGDFRRMLPLLAAATGIYTNRYREVADLIRDRHITIFIAIPALFFWQYFRARVNGYVMELELAAERFARHLEPLCPGRAADTGAGR